MCIRSSSFTKFAHGIALLSLGTGLLSNCSQAHQLGMEDDPQEILEMKLNNPQTELTPTQSVFLLGHCVALGEQNAATVANKSAITTLGETGIGKSTSINYWMGCDMVLRTPEALGLQGGLEDVIVVDPESTRPEVASIGHGDVSHTFMPQIANDPDNNRAYCDCPGFTDNRGAEINIANAVNIRQVLQQASGIKAVFLTKYQSLGDRGLGIRRMENMCQQLFGSVDNLRNHQDSVLLGINRAPAQTDLPRIRRRLEATGSPVLQLLANRTFLYDPLEQGGADFWSRDRFLTEIEQMPAIPQQVARNLFQTVLTGDDKVMLQQIVEHQVEALRNALEQNDYPAADRCWSLINQLQIIANRRIDELMNRQVRPHMRAYAEERAATFARHAAQHQFTEAAQLLTSLRTLNERFPDEHLVDLERLERTLQAARAQQAAQQEAEEGKQRAEERAQREAEERRQRAEEARQRAEEARQRAAEARQRAEEEAQRAEEARARAQRAREEMEARVRRQEAVLEAERKERQRNQIIGAVAGAVGVVGAIVGPVTIGDDEDGESSGVEINIRCSIM